MKAAHPNTPFICPQENSNLSLPRGRGKEVNRREMDETQNEGIVEREGIENALETSNSVQNTYLDGKPN